MANELRDEMDKLVRTYEAALKLGEQERQAYASRCDTFATEVVLHKAKLERLEMLVPVLKKRVTKQNIDAARLVCRFTTQFLTQKRDWTRQLEDVRVQLASDRAVAHVMVTMGAAVEEALLANKQEILLEVRRAAGCC